MSPVCSWETFDLLVACSLWCRVPLPYCQYNIVFKWHDWNLYESVYRLLAHHCPPLFIVPTLSHNRAMFAANSHLWVCRHIPLSSWTEWRQLHERPWTLTGAGADSLINWKSCSKRLGAQLCCKSIHHWARWINSDSDILLPRMKHKVEY